MRRACVGWCVHIPELLSRLVSQLVSHVSPCVPVADDAPAFPKSCPALCPCVGCCLRVPPLLDGVSAFLKPCLPSYLPSEVLSSPCPPFFPIVFPHVCPTCVPVLCDRLPLFLHMCACVGWCVRLPEVLPPLVSHSLPFCVPVFGWYDPLSPIVLPTYVPALDFRGLASACLSLSPHKCACPGWCVRFPEIFSLTFSSFLCPFVGWYARFPVLSPLVSLCLPLPPIVCHCLPTCESAFPRSCLPLCPFLFPFVGWCVCRPLALDYLPLSPFLFPFL